MIKISIRLFLTFGVIVLLSACQSKPSNLEYFIKDLNDQTIYEIVDEAVIHQFQTQFQHASPLQDTVMKNMDYELHMQKDVTPFYIEEPYIIFSQKEKLFISELVYPIEPILEEAIVYEP